MQVEYADVHDAPAHHLMRCLRCGAVVAMGDRITHTGWHRRTESTYAAPSTAAQEPASPVGTRLTRLLASRSDHPS